MHFAAGNLKLDPDKGLGGIANLINLDRGFGYFALARGLLRDVVYLS
jgi:hypothetical protein